MDIAKNQKYNLPDLFNSVFDLYIPRNLSHGATNLLFALLYKFNQVPDKKTGQFFPNKLGIYNFELAKMLGINEKTLIKLRSELVAFRLVSNNKDTWIAKYESGGTREAGVYQLNCHMIKNVNHSNLSEYYSQDSDQLENNNLTNSDSQDIIPQNDSNKAESQDIGNNIDATFPKNSKKASKRTALHNTTQHNLESSSSYTSNVPSTIQPTENIPIDSSSKTYETKDASGRYRSPMDHNFGDNGKKPPAKPPDAETNFEFIASQQRDVQLVLLKRLTEEKKAEFYEWVKSQKEV